jgi:PIN domain
MTKKRAYIETTVPNFYYDFREADAIVARRIATRQWWETAAERYHLLTSSVVFDELKEGTSDRVRLRLGLLDGIETVPLEPAVAHIVATYLQHKLMPAKPPGDAMHLALASFHDCDLIVSWNCRHIANPNKAVHVQRINTRLGLSVPQLATPLDLLEREP